MASALNGRQLPLGSASLRSRRLSSRPGDLPGPLYVHGGVAPTTVSAVVFRPEGLTIATT